VSTERGQWFGLSGASAFSSQLKLKMAAVAENNLKSTFNFREFQLSFLLYLKIIGLVKHFLRIHGFCEYVR